MLERSAYSIAKLAWKSVNCNDWPKYLQMAKVETRRPMRGGAIHQGIFLACQHNIRDTLRWMAQQCSMTSQRFVRTVRRILVSAEKQRNISWIKLLLDLIKMNTKFMAILIKFTFFILFHLLLFYCLHSSIILEFVMFCFFIFSSSCLFFRFDQRVAIWLRSH